MKLVRFACGEFYSVRGECSIRCLDKIPTRKKPKHPKIFGPICFNWAFYCHLGNKSAVSCEIFDLIWLQFNNRKIHRVVISINLRGQLSRYHRPFNCKCFACANDDIMLAIVIKAVSARDQ